MIVTMSELRASVQKALIGAGAPAGMREGGGEAALWLEARGIPALEWVLQAIEQCPDRPAAAFLPLLKRESNQITIEFGGRSALYFAPSLFDFLLSEAFNTKKPVRCAMKRLAHGAFLLPVLEEFSSQEVKTTLSSSNYELRAQSDQDNVALSGSWAASGPEGDYLITIGPHEEVLTAGDGQNALKEHYRHHLKQGIEVNDDLWRRLCEYAWRSYVPDSEESRRKGAG